jgi:hypothetical protein
MWIEEIFENINFKLFLTGSRLWQILPDRPNFIINYQRPQGEIGS